MSTDAPVTNRLDAERIERLIDARFPQIHSGARTLVIGSVAHASASDITNVTRGRAAQSQAPPCSR